MHERGLAAQGCGRRGQWLENGATAALTPLKAANVKHLIKALPVRMNKHRLIFICLRLLSLERVTQADVL